MWRRPGGGPDSGDPEARTLEVFESRDRLRVLVAALKGDDEVRAPPFDAIGFPLAALWPD